MWPVEGISIFLFDKYTFETTTIQTVVFELFCITIEPMGVTQAL